MRIRKRQVPLPLSSLSPIPVSDPHFNRSPMVQLQKSHDPHQNLTQQGDTSCSQFYYQPSDHPNQPIGTRNSGDDDGAAGVAAGGVIKQNQKDKDCLVLLEDEEDCYERGGEELGEKRSNDTRKNDILGAEIAAAGVLSQLSSSNQAVGRWGEGEKAFPLKKRRASFERGANEEEEEEKDKKMKTKMNKKFALKDDNDQRAEERVTKEINNGDDNTNNNSTSKKRARGGAIMEGSRCSRVNGRGWRCCQQTLVGYSLCEHHLGKGRLRSMNSVRNRSLGSSAPSKSEPKQPPLSSSSSTTLEESTKAKRELVSSESNAEEGAEEKPLMIPKRRMKLGMVKARSISSLLGQKDNEIIAANNI